MVAWSSVRWPTEHARHPGLRRAATVRWRTDELSASAILAPYAIASAGKHMSDRVLLVMANALAASAIRASLEGSPDVAFDVECVLRCSDGLQRLHDHRQDDIAAVVLDLFLPDSQGIKTVEAILRARPLVPILVVSRTQDESTAMQAVQHGAQDYLLLERVDRYTLPKALRGMLARSAHANALGREAAHAQVTLDAIGDAVVTTEQAGIQGVSALGLRPFRSSCGPPGSQAPARSR